AEALGFIRVTEHGRGGNAEHHAPNLFFLTFAHGRDSRAIPPPHDWRRIKTTEEAETIARSARANKSPNAVRSGIRASGKSKTRFAKRTPGPVRETATGNAKVPVRETVTTGSVSKSELLSRVWVGERSDPPASASPPLQPNPCLSEPYPYPNDP